LESVGSAILRHTPSERTELGREAKEISEDVVAELDAGTAKRAHATTGEGASLAAARGSRRGRSPPVVHHSTRPVLVIP
jgi:hypothetical protein